MKRFGVDDGTDRPMHMIIRDFKAKYGDDAYAVVEDKLLAYVNAREGGASTYEDVRGDGSSSGSWLRWKGL